jgi:hypothetical protein
MFDEDQLIDRKAQLPSPADEAVSDIRVKGGVTRQDPEVVP